MNIPVVNFQSGKEEGQIVLPESIYAGVKVNLPLVHQVLVAELAGRRQGTAASKTKGLVRGGGKKPFKQKGTGNARQGSSRSPLQPGGGSAFGPQPRDYSQRTPSKMFWGALRSVILDKALSQSLIVTRNVKSNGKTKNFCEAIAAISTDSSLLVTRDFDLDLFRASRNCEYLSSCDFSNVSIWKLLKYKKLLVTEDALKTLDQRLQGVFAS